MRWITVLLTVSAFKPYLSWTSPAPARVAWTPDTWRQVVVDQAGTGGFRLANEARLQRWEGAHGATPPRGIPAAAVAALVVGVALGAKVHRAMAAVSAEADREVDCLVLGAGVSD